MDVGVDDGDEFERVRDAGKDVFSVLGSPCLLSVSFIERSRLGTFSLPCPTS